MLQLKTWSSQINNFFKIIHITKFYPEVVQYAFLRNKKTIFWYKDTLLYNHNTILTHTMVNNSLLNFSIYPENTPLPSACLNWNTSKNHTLP